MRMTGMLNFREFYQRKPLLISPSDLSAIQEEESWFDTCTHWLIALEGCEERGNAIRWRVVIYPSGADGYFNHVAASQNLSRGRRAVQRNGGHRQTGPAGRCQKIERIRETLLSPF
jgi:hypothetical protein